MSGGMRAISGTLAVLKHVAARARSIFQNNEQAKRCAPWFAIDGDRTLRLEYPLTEESIVLDVGAYKGDFASDIYARFRCTVHAFEPIREFAAQTTARFQHNPSVIVHTQALGVESGQSTISLLNDSSSRQTSGGETESIEVKGVRDFFEESGLNHVDLIKINIEGDEYDLINALAENGLLERIEHIQVQFHPIPNCDALVATAQAHLRQTHDQRWAYPLVWESWSRRP